MTTETLAACEGGTAMYAVDEEACMGCGLCVACCPAGAVSVKGRVAEIDRDACTGCGACGDECPQGAIYEYEILPAPRQGAGAPARYASSGSGPAFWPKFPALTRREKAAAAAALLPILSRLLLKAAGRVSLRGRESRRPRSGGAEAPGPIGHASAGRHRWHGGRD